MSLDSAGNLGLGVTPSVRIEAQDGATGAAIRASNSGGGFAQISVESNATSEARLTFTNALKFIDSSTERARIDSSGNLLVGRTSTLGGARISAETVTGTPTYAAYLPTTGTETAFLFVNPNGVVGSITTNGSATLYNVTSDQRLKENIAEAASASDLIDAIQVRQYNWKSDGSHQRYGFIAQELVTVAPEAVHQPADPEEMMAVDSSKLVPMLVKEIQSLRQRVASLESN
jgi:hypothetical protein